MSPPSRSGVFKIRAPLRGRPSEQRQSPAFSTVSQVSTPMTAVTRCPGVALAPARSCDMRWISSCGVFVLMPALFAAAQQPPNAGVPTGARQPGPAQPAARSQARADAPDTGTARISGRVVSDTGAAVRGAEVRLSGD